MGDNAKYNYLNHFVLDNIGHIEGSTPLNHSKLIQPTLPKAKVFDDDVRVILHFGVKGKKARQRRWCSFFKEVLAIFYLIIFLEHLISIAQPQFIPMVTTDFINVALIFTSSTPL